MRSALKALVPAVVAVAAVTVMTLPTTTPVTASTPAAVAPAVTYGGVVSELRADGTERLHALSPSGAVIRTEGKQSFTYLFPKQGKRNPARWNRCEPIHYMVNPKGMPKEASTVIPAALKRVSKATGLKFVKAGTTKVIPYATASWSERFRGDSRNLLVIASATGKQVRAFSGGTLGYGGPMWRTIGNSDPEIFLAGVTVNRAANLQPGFVGRDGSPTWGQLFLHELGHAMNLGHVEDAKQIMFPSLSVNAPSDYADGDRAGLTALRALPCFKN